MKILNLNRRLLLITFVAVSFGLFLESAYALGTVVSRSGANLIPGELTCLDYKVYNTGDIDTYSVISPSEELESIALPVNDPVLIPANTGPDDPTLVNVCFRFPENTYEDDPECLGPTVSYTGKVYIAEVSGDSPAGGSSTTFGTLVPLTLAAECDSEVEMQRGKLGLAGTLLLSAIIILVAVIAVLLVIRFKPKRGQKNNSIKQKRNK